MVLGGLFGSPGPQSPKDLGYERSKEFDDLIDYPNEQFFTKDDAKDFSGALLDGIQEGNMDVNTALGLLGSRVQPGSSFYKSQAFDNLLNYQMGEDNSKNLIGDAFNTNYFRSGSVDEINALYDQAATAGVLNNPNELRNFATSQMARTPEGQRKRPLDDYQLRMASYYGAPVIGDDGTNTGLYQTFGSDPDKYVAAAKQMQKTQSFTNNFLNRLGA
tara:strand:+ start:829 stop:1479 length:651 start_codon:yes stop_codon:yes gene_type:complete